MNDPLMPAASLAGDLALTLLHFLWQGTLIAGAVWLVLHLAHRARPTTRYGIVLLGGALCGLAPIVTLILLRQEVTAGVPTSQVIIDPVTARIIAANADAIALRTEDAVPLPAWQLGLLGCWSLGVLLMAVRLLIGGVSVLRLRRQSGPVTPGVVELAGGFAARLGLRRLPRIAVSSRVAEAMVVGLLRPMILLPAGWLAELPPDVLAAVLAHELAHIRRLDPWVNAMQRIMETLLFYHPGVWWLSRRLRIEREFCCDELAVRITGQPLVYARTLELVAHRRLDRRIPALATGIGDRKMTLLKRVHNVLGGGREDPPRGLLTPLAAVLVVLLGLAVYRMAWFSPATLLADDEPRRDREVERARRGDDEREREERRRERRTETRRERSEREDKGEERDGRYQDEIELEGNVSPDVVETIRDVLSQLENYRTRAREVGAEIQIFIEVREGDDDEPKVIVHRINLSRREDTEGEHEVTDDRVQEREGPAHPPERESDPATDLPDLQVEVRDVDGDGEPDARVIREGRILRVETIEREDGHHERRDEPARRLLDEAERPGADAEHRRGDEPRSEDGFERRAPAGGFARGFPGGGARGGSPRVTVRPPTPPMVEERDGLAAEVRELRQQVRDLAELVGDLRESLRERDADGEARERRSEDEAQERSGRDREDDEDVPPQLRLEYRRQLERDEADRDTDSRRGGARDDGARDSRDSAFERIRERREEETEFRRNRNSGEEAATGEDEVEESARTETDNARQFTVRSTGDGNVRVYVREGDRDSVLEARVIELTDDGRIKLETANPQSEDANPPDAAASDSQDAGDAADLSGGGAGESAEESADDSSGADPFRADE